MEKLYTEVKRLIINSLNLKGITIDDIGTNEPLFNDGLGLDSIDAVELGLAVRKRYSIVINAEEKYARKHFNSVATLARFISNTKPA